MTSYEVEQQEEKLMKRKLILSLVALIVLIAMSGVALALTPPTGGVSYYNFSSVTDLWGNNDATNNSATSNSSYPSFNITGDSDPNSYSFDGNDWVDSNQWLNAGDFAISIWLKAGSQADGSPMGDNDAGTGYHDGFRLRLLDQATRYDTLSIIYGDGSSQETFFSSQYVYTWDEWNHVVVSYDSSDKRWVVWLNGSVVINDTGTLVKTTDSNFQIGRQGDNSRYYTGDADEVKIFNRTVNQTEVSNLYNYGDVKGVSVYLPPSNNFTVFVKDYWTNNSLSDAWVYMNNTNYTDASGNITTNILNNITSLYNITVGSPNAFNQEFLNYNVSSNLTVYLKASNITFNVFEYLTGNALEANITIDGVTKLNNTLFHLDTGSHTALVSRGGYYSQNFSLSVSGRDVKTVNLSGLYNSILNITVNDNWTSNAINDFSINISNATLGFSFYNTTTNGYIAYPLINNSSYSVSVIPDLNLFNADSATLLVNNSAFNYTSSYTLITVLTYLLRTLPKLLLLSSLT